MALNIIYEDNKIIVVDKPAGKLTQSGKSFDVDLVSELMTYRKRKGEKPYVAVLNRLDRPVSGIVLFAKDAGTAAELSKLMQSKGFSKEYMAWVIGHAEDSATLVDFLVKDGRTNKSEVVSQGTYGAKRAELRYTTVKRANVSVSGKLQEISLVKIQLITGRHHQIRAQFSSRGMALLGDVKYGGILVDEIEELRRNEIALCAYKLDIGARKFETKAEWM